MRFEFDHRSGGMVPKKDDNIYFAQSQGGGLIVDDKKNNVRYIVERDGRITKLFGSFRGDELNIYDMRDARMISDRVKRLLGPNHKYGDFHYFLRGYHMTEQVVQTCSSFLDESVWSDFEDRGTGDVIKPEDGEIIGETEDGIKLVIPAEYKSYGKLVIFDDDKKFYDLNGTIIAIANENGTDTYYRYDDGTDELVNMVECFTADDSIRNENDFGLLRAIMEEAGYSGDDLDGMEIELYSNYSRIVNGREEYMVFTDYDDVQKYAYESEKDLIEGSLDKATIKHYYEMFGDSIIDVDGIEETMKEYYGSTFDDLVYDDEATDKLLEMGIIEKTDEYFDTDEDGDIDTDLPLFDPDDYKDSYVQKCVDDCRDIVDEYISIDGYDGMENYLKYDELAEKIVDNDGPEATIASYDGKYRDQLIGDITYYIYRTN